MGRASGTTLGHVPTCRECGSTTADEDRFCSSCGASSAYKPSGLLGMDSAVSQSTEVTTRGTTRFLVPAAVGLALIAGLFWALAGESADPDTRDEAAATEQSSTSRPSTTTAPTSATGGPLSFDEAVEVETGPLLGREVGLSLLIGGSSGSLRQIDLDTARVVELDVGRRRPVFATGDWLITVSDYSDDLQAVSMTDPEAAATPLGTSDFWPESVFAAPEPDSIWIIGGASRTPSGGWSV